MRVACERGDRLLSHERTSPFGVNMPFGNGASSTMDIEFIENRLGGYEAKRINNQGQRPVAAVVAMVRPGRGGAELLLIERAEHPDDPWSGHMALPGGRYEPCDA